MTSLAILADVLEAELLRTDPQTAGARARAAAMTPAVLAWVGERMLARDEAGRRA
jgi:hypothetical protein